MFLKSIFVISLSFLVSACSHSIIISPSESVKSDLKPVSDKKVAYVLTDDDRNKQFNTEGGGGDKVNYYAYRDVEKVIRDALKSTYSDVYILKSVTDVNSINENNISLIFSPVISTSSGSESMLTWPPTKFSIVLSCDVTDKTGKKIKRISAVGSGKAEYSEFMSDFGLSGRRAAEDLSRNLIKLLREDTELR